ncbi:MAG: hypothetical protein MJ188_04005 [Treponema sp.]|nr:hypothetical protein [Treponema sp.]
MVDFDFWMAYGADEGTIPIDLYGNSAVLKNALNELKRASSKIENAGRVVIGKLDSLPKKYQKHITNSDLIKDDGFVVARVNANRRKPETKWDECTVITAKNENGVLYGVFSFIRHALLENYASLVQLMENPDYTNRIVDCRGLYELIHKKTKSSKNQPKLPKHFIHWELKAFFRVLASIGINTVIFEDDILIPEKILGEWGLKLIQSNDSEENDKLNFPDLSTNTILDGLKFQKDSCGFYVLGRRSWNKELSEDFIINEWNTLIKGFAE